MFLVLVVCCHTQVPGAENIKIHRKGDQNRSDDVDDDPSGMEKQEGGE